MHAKCTRSHVRHAWMKREGQVVGARDMFIHRELLLVLDKAGLRLAFIITSVRERSSSLGRLLRAAAGCAHLHLAVPVARVMAGGDADGGG